MAGTPYQELIQAIADYYGSGSDQWLQVAQYGTTADDFIDIVSQLPNYEVVTNKAGDIISYQKIDSIAVSNSASVIDSNVVTAPVKISTPATVTTAETTGEVVASKGITTASGIQFMTKSVLPAIGAVGVGISCGKKLNELAYAANPHFWDSLGVMSPDDWYRITADMHESTGQEVLATAFNLLWGIDPNSNKAQAYIDQNAFAYLALYMENNGVFDYATYDEMTTEDDTPITIAGEVHTTTSAFFSGVDYEGNPLTTTMEFSEPVVLDYDGSSWGVIIASEEPNHIVTVNISQSNGRTRTQILNSAEVHDLYGKRYSCSSTHFNWFEPVALSDRLLSVNGSCNADVSPSGHNTVGYLMLYGETSGGAPEGFDNQPSAIIPNLKGITTVDGALTALQTQYPDLFNNAITYPVMQPDGTTTNYIYVPIALPDATSAVDPQPTASGEYLTQAKPAYDPTTMPSTLWDELWKVLELSGKEVDTPTDTMGDGDTPPVVPPSGSASALWKIYNPSQSQLDAFGSWLWSSDFVDQLKKLFNDPMQAIIGLHKVFVNPPISGSGAIKVGYLVSDATANYVSHQYVDVDCGTVKLEEYFKNVFDYENTQVSIYLPFCGIHKLNVNDIMRGDITVIYHVDVLTGACLIDVKVIRDLAGGVIYTFSGNCAVQYPVSSGSYVGIITGLLGIAGGIAGSVASGGAIAPMLLGAGASIGRMHADVSHSGNISSNAGAMGAKKPYLIIERPQTKTPISSMNTEGRPQNEMITLSSLSGYAKVKIAKHDGLTCTSDELDILKELLEKGIYIQ